MPFIKRDKFNNIKDTIIPDLLSLKRPCVFFNLLHEPGCGGTTLAKHILWELRDKFRCAVLKDTTAVPTEVAQQVVELLTFETTEQSTRIPVLLMIDDFQEIYVIYHLQQLIENECFNKNIKQKLEKIKTINKNAWKRFYGFRILMEKKKFRCSEEYVKAISLIVKSFLTFNASQCSVPAKLRIHLEQLSRLLIRCADNGSRNFEALRLIHPSIAVHCLNVLKIKHKVSKADIINLTLTTNMLIGACIKGREKLRHDICNLLLRRQMSAKGKESQFSQLINHIAKETPKDMET
ncbi:unnamed protein product, partial [Coregonus sp. 'balchen']